MPIKPFRRNLKIVSRPARGSWRVGDINSYNAFIGQKLTAKIPTLVGSSQTRPLGEAVAIKDNIATAGGPTTCASGFLKDYVSPFEASIVRGFRQNGYIATEKTNMDEFGMGSHSVHSYFGPVYNTSPYAQFSAGGSSGGSAMAVAMKTRGFALGTDTGGSVRLPAAYTGVVGFKPSYGRISRSGVIPYANSLDTVGIFSKFCSKSLGRFLRSLSRPDLRDPSMVTSASRRRIREARRVRDTSRIESRRFKIGVPTEYNLEELQPIIRDAWTRVLEQCQTKGHKIVPVSLPSTKHALSAYYVLAAAEAASNLAKYDGVRYGTPRQESDSDETVLYDSVRGNGFGDEVKRRILLGSYTLSSEAIDNYFIQAQKVRRLVQRDFDRIFLTPNPLRPPQQFDLSDLDDDTELEDKLGPAQVDVLVCPTAPTLPPRLKDIHNQNSVDQYMNDVFTVPASLAGLPALSIPVGITSTDDNVPFAGIQVIGQYWDDNLVLRVGGLIGHYIDNRRKHKTSIVTEGPVDE